MTPMMKLEILDSGTVTTCDYDQKKIDYSIHDHSFIWITVNILTYWRVAWQVMTDLDLIYSRLRGRSLS